MAIYTVGDFVHEKASAYLPGIELKNRNQLNKVLGKEPVLILGHKGNFHADTYYLIEEIQTDISLLFFDAHTDRLQSPGEKWPNCANLTFHISKLEPVKEVIYLGVNGVKVVQADRMIKELLQNCRLYASRNNISRLQGSSLGGFVEVYLNNITSLPTINPELKRVLEENSSVWDFHFFDSNGEFTLAIEWEQLSDFDPRTVITDDVYVSTDVDVFLKTCGFPIGDFDRAHLSVGEYLSQLQRIADHKRILALDITGFDWNEVKDAKPKELILAAHEIVNSQ